MEKLQKEEQSYSRRNMVIILAIALVVRIVYLIEASASPFFENMFADPRFYDLWAKTIAGESFFPAGVLFRAPLYAYFAGIIYAISANSKFVLGIAQAILGAFSCGLVYMIARRFFSEKAAVTAGIIAALYGVFIYMDADLFPATLAAFFMLLSVYWLARINKDSSLKQYLIAGLFAGLAAITMPFLATFGILIFVWIFFRFRATIATRLSRWGVLLAGMLIVIAPITLHNLAESGGLIPISSNLGLELFAGNNIGANGRSPYLVGQSPEIVRDSSLARNVAEGISKKELSPRGVCTFYRGQALTFFTTDPGHALGLFVKKISMILNGHESHPDGSLYFERRYSTLLSVLVWDKIVAFPMGILIPLCIVGLIMTASSWRKLMLLYAFTLSAALVPLMLYVNIETRLVLMLAVIIFASAGLFEFVGRIAKGDFQRLIVPIVAFLIFLFVSNFKFVNLDEDYATEFLRLGTMAWNNGDTANAERAYIEGLQYNDNSPTLLNGLGNIYYRQGIYQEAEKKYRRALIARPDFFDARKNLILTLEKEHGEGTLYDYYAELLSYFPNSAFGLKRMADYFLGEGENDSAAVYYKRWTEVEPNNPDAEFGLGNALTRLGKGEEARKIYEGLVYKYPEEPTVHLNLGIVYMQLGLDNLAEEEFETVLYYDTNSTYALYNLAQMYDSRGDSVMAQNLYMKILAVDPDFYADPEAIIDSLMQYAIPADSLMKSE